MPFYLPLEPTLVYVHRLAVTGTARADQVREYFESKYGPVKEVVSLYGLYMHFTPRCTMPAGVKCSSLLAICSTCSFLHKEFVW